MEKNIDRITAKTLGEDNVHKIIIEEDIIVKDVNPDILTLIDTSAVVIKENIQQENNKCIISGVIRCSILYISDDEEGDASNMIFEVPFQEKIDIDGNSDDLIFTIKPNYIKSVAINSRKINVKGILDVHLKSVKEISENILTDISDTSAQTITRKISYDRILDNNKFNFTLKERENISKSKLEIDEILIDYTKVGNADTMYINGDMYLTSNVSCTIIYKSYETDNLDFAEINIPIREKIEGFDEEEAPYDIHLKIVDMAIDIEKDSSDEKRVLEFTMMIEADYIVEAKEEIEVIDDAYSIDKEITLRKKEIDLVKTVSRNKNSYSIREIINLEDKNILQVYNVASNVNIESITVKNNVTEVKGEINSKMLYVMSDDNNIINSYDISIPFVQMVDTNASKENMIPSAYISIDGINFAVLNPHEVEIRYNLCIDLKIVHKLKENIICDIEISELEEKTNFKKMYVCKLKNDMRVWDIAKKYGTKTENIKTCDREELKKDEILSKGDKVLII